MRALLKPSPVGEEAIRAQSSPVPDGTNRNNRSRERLDRVRKGGGGVLQHPVLPTWGGVGGDGLTGHEIGVEGNSGSNGKFRKENNVRHADSLAGDVVEGR